jgi:probable F420-dependent oxidoreductase
LAHPFRFAVFAFKANSGKEWAEKARRFEALGYGVLAMPDHFVNPLPPVPALAAAAAATTTLRIASVVFANDYKHPAVLAKEAATLDLLSDGRFELGLGAGWLKKEYEQVGIPFDPPGVRIERMVESLGIINRLWADGPVTHHGPHYTIDGLEGLPKPVQQPHPPVFIGGTGKRMLQVAAREADIVGLLPKTLPQGGHDWLGSTFAVVEQQRDWIREAAGDRFDALELSCVAFRAIVTDDFRAAAESSCDEYDLTVEQMLASPDFLIGSVDGIVAQLQERRERYGISYIEVIEDDADAFAPVVAQLAGR